jgi:DNA-binding transcriptional LysR family regulator
MSLNLHHLRLFTAVVEHGGFTRAASVLRLSQPAISKSLAELERQVGMPLIDRTGRAGRLTDAGRSLYERAREIFGAERAAERELRELRGLERGRLRVGASTTIATYMLPGLLGKYHVAFPRIDIRASSANTRSIARMLLEWRVDVALVEGPIEDTRFDVVPWKRDELVVIAHPTHRFAAKGRSVAAAEMAAETFIVREPGSGTREVVRRALADRGISLRRTMRVGGTEVIKQAVAAGLGLAIVSRAAAADQLALGRLATVRVEGLAIERQLSRLRLRGRVANAAGRAFDALLDRASEDVGMADASGDPG